MLLFCAGMACGVMGLAGLSVAAVRTIEGSDAAGVESDRPVAIVLVAADHANVIERTVDTQTGRRGFSHVVVDCGEVDQDGRRLVYDCFPREGVRRVVLSERYGTCRGQLRKRVQVTLPEADGDRMRGAMAALVGAPYDVAATIDPRRRGLVCSRLVMRGLSEDLAARVRPHTPRHPISPNDLARAFGVRGPNSPDVAIPARSSR